MENLFTLVDKTIFVTGATSGIGRTIAIACAKAGSRVVLNGRNEERLQETFDTIGDQKNIKMAADVTDIEKLPELTKELPLLDGVVLCAGVGQTTPIQNVKYEKTESVFKTNTLANIQLLQLLIKDKKINKGGSVVIISSIASHKPYFGNAVYSASKGALNSYAKVAAMELAGRGIRVNCIEPGLIVTDIVTSAGFDETQLAEFEKTMPLGFGKPEDIANGCVYLLSDAARWVTGSNLIIDGGQTLL